MAGTFGFERLMSYVQQLPGKMRQAQREALTDCALAVEGRVRRIIETGGKTVASPIWPMWAPATRKAREERRSTMHRARGTGMEMLYDTGHMMRQVTHEVGEEVAIVGSPLVYDPVHEFGTHQAGRGRETVIPARPHYLPAMRDELPGVEAKFVKRMRAAGT